MAIQQNKLCGIFYNIRQSQFFKNFRKLQQKKFFQRQYQFLAAREPLIWTTRDSHCSQKSTFRKSQKPKVQYKNQPKAKKVSQHCAQNLHRTFLAQKQKITKAFAVTHNFPKRLTSQISRKQPVQLSLPLLNITEVCSNNFCPLKLS